MTLVEPNILLHQLLNASGFYTRYHESHITKSNHYDELPVALTDSVNYVSDHHIPSQDRTGEITNVY